MVVVSGAGERWRGGEKGGRGGGYIDRRREVAGGQPIILKILPDLGAPFFFFSFFFFFPFSSLICSGPRLAYFLISQKEIKIYL